MSGLMRKFNYEEYYKQIQMNKQKEHIEFSNKIVGIITAIIALLSVIGAFYQRTLLAGRIYYQIN